MTNIQDQSKTVAYETHVLGKSQEKAGYSTLAAKFSRTYGLNAFDNVIEHSGAGDIVALQVEC